MTLSLRSRFSGAARRVFHLDGRQLAVYEWRQGVTQPGPVFPGGEPGLEAFGGYLRETASVPACLLVDAVEEEYRRDTLPHVIGQDRQTLIRHRAKRLFRETPYWYAELQGREAGGRRDDIVLYTVLGNQALLAPWLDVMGRRRVPLVGIYSLPLLSAGLLRYVDLASDHALLVSMQGPGRLRQSFFQGSYLKISRLAHVASAQPSQDVAAILDEVEKLRRYLNSLRLLPRPGALDVYLLGHGEMFAELEREALNTGSVRYHLVDTGDLAWRLGMGRDFDSPYSESLFVQLLLRNRPANHYATPDQTHYFAMRRVRVAMLAASAALMFGSLLWSTLQLVEGVMYRERTAVARQQTDFYTQRYERARAEMPTVPAEPAELKSAVDTARILERTRSTPLPVMQLLGRVLRDYPVLRIHELEWRVRRETGAPRRGGGRGRAVGFAGTTGSNAPGVLAGPREAAVVHGQVFPFDGDFRKALQMVQDFAQALASREGVLDVEVLTMPLNVSPTESLKGDVGASPGADRARFSIRMSVSHGTGRV